MARQKDGERKEMNVQKLVNKSTWRENMGFPCIAGTSFQKTSNHFKIICQTLNLF